MKLPDDFIARLGKEYLQMLAEEDNSNYVANGEQAEKYCDMVKFLSHIAKSTVGGSITVECEPKGQHGYVNATFPVFDLSGEQVAQFATLLAGASAFDVDSLKDGSVCLSITIPNVYVHI